MKTLSDYNANIIIQDVNNHLWMFGSYSETELATHRIHVDFEVNGVRWIWRQWFDINKIKIQDVLKLAVEAIKKKADV